jgi:hypothetical protein
MDRWMTERQTDDKTSYSKTLVAEFGGELFTEKFFHINAFKFSCQILEKKLLFNHTRTTNRIMVLFCVSENAVMQKYVKWLLKLLCPSEFYVTCGAY